MDIYRMINTIKGEDPDEPKLTGNFDIIHMHPADEKRVTYYLRMHTEKSLSFKEEPPVIPHELNLHFPSGIEWVKRERQEEQGDSKLEAMDKQREIHTNNKERYEVRTDKNEGYRKIFKPNI